MSPYRSRPLQEPLSAWDDWISKQYTLILSECFTYQGAEQDEDGETSVLLHTEGIYDMRGSVFSIVVTISALARRP
jgi:hypothetical protein